MLEFASFTMRLFCITWVSVVACPYAGLLHGHLYLSGLHRPSRGPGLAPARHATHGPCARHVV